MVLVWETNRHRFWLLALNLWCRAQPKSETGCSTCCTLTVFDKKWRKKERCFNRALSKAKQQRKIGLRKKGQEGR